MKKHWYISLPALCGFLFLLWLSSCARLAYDDYLFAACFKQHSFIDAITILSNTHTFRWTTFLLQDLVFGLVPGQYFPISIFLFFLLFYSLWIYQLHKLVKTVTEKYLNVTIDSSLALGLATLFILALYFAASQAVETFTFHGAVCDRLVPLFLITIVLNVLMGPNKGWRTYLKLAFYALLIAGTAENVTVILVMALVLIMIWKKFVARSIVSSAVIFFVVELAIFLAMELLSPGSDARYQAEKVHRFTCGPDNSYCADSLLLFLSRFFQWRQLLVVPILFVFLVAVAELSPETRSTLRVLARKALFYLLIVLLPAIVFHLIAVQWIFDCYGPMRLWFPINVLIALIAMFGMVYLGCAEWKSPAFLWMGAAVMSIAIVMFYVQRHYASTSAYRNAYDARISYLISLPPTGEVIEVEALPPADLVVEGDIMQDADDDVNRDFVNAYGLPFKVKKK